ncbi:MAG: hypothetical protein O7B81_01540, partial [Gammaproteobacteria bacterium]|nr:hypothetical protein [Gammaproteobacteria bacterium]
GSFPELHFTPSVKARAAPGRQEAVTVMSLMKPQTLRMVDTASQGLLRWQLISMDRRANNQVFHQPDKLRSSKFKGPTGC